MNELMFFWVCWWAVPNAKAYLNRERMDNIDVWLIGKNGTARSIDVLIKP